MLDALELAIALLAGIGLPAALILSYRDKKTKKTPIIWWVQAALWHLMCFWACPTMIHFTQLETPSVSWEVAGSVATYSVFALLALSAICYVYYIAVQWHGHRLCQAK